MSRRGRSSRAGGLPRAARVAYDASLDAIHVACAGGELVTLPASGGPAVRKLRLAPDLRDVVVEGDRLLVSRFRSAETLVVGPDGAVLSRRTLPVFYSNGFANSEYAPSVAWRMAPLAGGGALMVHQRSMSSKVTSARRLLPVCRLRREHRARRGQQDRPGGRS